MSAAGSLPSPRTPKLPPKPDQPSKKGLRSIAAKLAKLVGDSKVNKSTIPALPPQPSVTPITTPESTCPITTLAKFDANEIDVLAKLYKELSARNTVDGTGITKATFVDYFPLPGVWVDRLYTIFRNGLKEGPITYSELMYGLAICCRGTKLDKVKIFDLNADGVISKEELTLLLSNLPNLPIFFEQTCLDDTAAAPLISQTKCGIAPPSDAAPPTQAETWTVKSSRETQNDLIQNEYSSSSSSLSSHLAILWDQIDMHRWHPEDEQYPEEPDNELQEKYLLGAGPSPIVAELLAQVDPSRITAEMQDLDVIAQSIMDNYDASESLTLTFEEFRAFVEHHPKFLTLLSECLREELWGLQGSALYRQNQKFARPPPSNSGNMAPSGSATESSKFDETTAIPEIVLLEKWIKVQKLFNQAAPRQLSCCRSSQKEPSVFLAGWENAPDVSTSCNTTDSAPVYPRHSRYAGSREVLDFLEVSLGQFVSDDEDHPEGPHIVNGLCCVPPTQDTQQLWQEKLDALNCPNCHSPLIVCPCCDRRFPTLRLLDAQRLVVECAECTGGVTQQWTTCWICQWPFATAIQMVDRKDALMEGLLWKLGKHSRKWAIRQFVLVDKLLYYYVNPEDNIPKGFIFLEGCYVDPICQEGDLLTIEDKKKYGFCIIHSEGIFGRRDFFAEDEKTRDEWVDILRTTLNQQPIGELFEMHEIIGHGKFSVVYRATEKTTSEEFAMKVINKSRMSTAEKELLRGEIAIMRLLRHPHVISLRSIVSSRDYAHIVMELVPGGELFDVISGRGPLGEITVNRLTSQILRTLLYLHQSGIIHRDLKPENILLTSRNVDQADIKVADFGLSCICGPSERLYQPCGTLVYVAPEILTLQGYNHAIDLWSLGAVVYLLLSGKLPFPIMKTSGLRVLTDREKFYTPKFDHPAWKSVSKSAEDFILKLLEIDPVKRLTASEALNHIWIKVTTTGPSQSSQQNPTAVLRDVTLKPSASQVTIPNETASASPIETMPKRHADEKNEESPAPKHLTGSSRTRHEDDIMDEDSVATIDEPVLPPHSMDDDESSENSDDMDEDDSLEEGSVAPVFRFGQDRLQEGEELTYDPSAYDVFHQFYLAESCLSMDIVPDEYGILRGDPPHQFRIVGGTQAENVNNNSIMVAKCHNIQKTWAQDSDDEDQRDLQSAPGQRVTDAILDYSHIKTYSAINAVKISPHLSSLCASWDDSGMISVYKIENHLGILDNPGSIVANPTQKPIYTSQQHSNEGFALTWNKSVVGQLLSGSRDHTIGILNPIPGGWAAGRRIDHHQGSVESLSFQHNDPNVFASGSADKSIAIWDIRDLTKPTSVLEDAHNGDVNVVAFRLLENTNHILSGGDDGHIVLRDIRMWNLPLFKQTFHKEPVNCLEWHPVDNSMFLATSYDDSVSIWSLDIEGDFDVEAAQKIPGASHYPSQLIFLHLGQKHISCAKWHPQIPGLIISTAQSGFNVFRPENLVNN